MLAAQAAQGRLGEAVNGNTKEDIATVYGEEVHVPAYRVGSRKSTSRAT